MDTELKNPPEGSAGAESEVKNNPQDASQGTQENVIATPDPSEELIKHSEALIAKLTQVEKERDDYKAGMLDAKRILKDNGQYVEFDENKIAEIVDQKVQQRLNETLPTKTEAEMLRKKTEELATALRNKAQINQASIGGSQEKNFQGSDNRTMSDASKEAIRKNIPWAKNWKEEDFKRYEENLGKYVPPA